MKCHPSVSIKWSPNSVPKGLYRQLFFSRRPGLKSGGTLPGLLCEANGVHVESGNLSAYRFVIQKTGDEHQVPLFYPHALFGSAHLMMISHAEFPLSAVGLLHLRNHLIQHAPFGIDKPWDMKCELARQRQVEKGIEFDFDSMVTIEGSVVWESISTYLKRGKSKGAVEESPLADLFPTLDKEAKGIGNFGVPHNIGRRYAKVTGDYNPIHVSSLLAKLFGFKRAIAHGMWSVARAMQVLPPIDYPVRHDVAFKGPLLVNSQATLKHDMESRFDIYGGTNPRPVIVGQFQAAYEAERLLEFDD